MSKRGASILVVDDEREIQRALQRSLVAQGYHVLTASSGEEAILKVFQHHPDLILLDLLLPGMSGLGVCQEIRAFAASLPIIVLSIQDAEGEKVRALDLGADDYIAKPFHMNEVLARIRVALRRLARSEQGTQACFQAGPLSVDFLHRQVLLQGEEISLTPIEYDLLKVFITHRGKLLTKHMLVQEIWGTKEAGRNHSLHVYVARLRQKIEPQSEPFRFIRTIPGVGYCFREAADEEQSRLH